MQQPQATGVSPLKVFGKMLKFYRNRSALTSDQLGALVNLSGSAIRKIESGRQAPIASLVDALEAIPGLRCDGALRELFDQMSEYLTNGVFPGWFQGWPGKEAAAVRLRSFQLVVPPVSGQIIEDEDAIRELAHPWEALQRVTLPETLSVRKIEETMAGLWT